MNVLFAPAAAYYNELSSIYDETTSVSGVWTPPEFIKNEILCCNANHTSALVIGVGTGQDLEALITKKIPHIEGIDISSGMLECAKSKFPNVHFNEGDFITYDAFERQKYDLIICSGTLEFIPDFSTFFKKSSQMLSTSGQMILTYEPLIHNHKIQQNPQSETVPIGASKWYVPDFMTYRRPLDMFLKNIKENNLALEHFFEFIAYRKLDTDIIYHLARLNALSQQ